jgi:hypothetical protein
VTNSGTDGSLRRSEAVPVRSEAHAIGLRVNPMQNSDTYRCSDSVVLPNIAELTAAQPQ